MAGSSRSVLARYGGATVAVALATAARVALDPFLGDVVPFATLFLAVLVVSATAGLGASLFTTALGAVAAARFLLRPRDAISVERFEDRVGLAVYLVVGSGIAILGGRLRSARMRAEADALLSARERDQARTILASIGDAVIVTDRAGGVESLNPVAEALTGWTIAESVGKSVEEIFRVTDEATRRPLECPANHALRQGRVVRPTNHVTLSARDGSELSIDNNAAPIRDQTGNITGVVVVFRDISARRAAEKQLWRESEMLRLFVQHVPAGVAMLDRDMRSVVVSRRWASYFGIDPDHAIGKNHVDIFPENASRFRDVFERCLAGAVERADEDSLKRPDGLEDWFRWEVRPWSDDRGTIGGIIMFTEIITEQKRTRQAVQEQADTLSGVLNNSADHIFVVDGSGRYRYVSAGGAAVLGLEPKDMQGKHWSELGLPPDLMRQFENERDQVLRSGQPARHETHYVGPGGAAIDFDYTIAPVRGADGHADAVVVVSRDVTSHRIAERERQNLVRELETQNAFIHAVLTQVPAAIVVANAVTGQLMLSNDEAHRIVGHRYEPGSRIEDYGTTYIRQALRPDGSRYQTGEWPLDRAIAGETIVGEELELHLSTGQRVTIRLNAGPIRVGDEVVAAVVAFHDITARKAIEQTARFLADASSILAGVIDYESTLQKVAHLAVPTFADWAVVYLTDNNGEAAPRRIAVAHSDPSKVEQALEMTRRYPTDIAAPSGPAHVIRTGRSELVSEITAPMTAARASDDEHLRMLEQLGLKSYMCVPLATRGKILGVLMFLSAESARRYNQHDLTVAEDLASRAAIAIENARLYAELKEADRSKNEFLATLAHELRNPLVPIRNVLRLLRDPAAAASVDNHEIERAMAERQVVHLTRLIDDLMDVARISRGKIELHTQPVDLATIVSQAVETSRFLIAERRHQLTVSIPESRITLEADPTRLEQVFWNLLNNAAKYTEPGGAIAIGVEPGDGDVTIRVRDSGIGIRPDMLPHIFTMFVQVGDHKDHALGGLGIGLSLVRTIVEMHGGSITARSDGPNRGSEFVVRLPVVSQANDEPRAPLDAGLAVAPKPPGRRILVVDDNVDAARSLAILLKALYGQDVRLAASGPEALAVAGEFHPEVVLLDIGLPGMDGNEVARRLRSCPEYDGTLIVALTGWGQESSIERSHAAGFDHYLVKPANPDAIAALLMKKRSRAHAP